MTVRSPASWRTLGTNVGFVVGHLSGICRAHPALVLAVNPAPREQQHTMTRIYQRLLDDHAMTGVPYPVLQRLVGDA